jgi:hypothetical protein
MRKLEIHWKAGIACSYDETIERYRDQILYNILYNTAWSAA